MRKLLGKLGEANSRPLLRAATLLRLFFPVFLLIAPETASSQIWVTSGFKVTPGGQTETAYCSTSAIDPATGQPSPAAADYSAFYASCTLSGSDGSVIYPTQCPGGYQGSVYSFPYGNPTGQCSTSFTPKPGVTYTLTSTHTLGFYVAPPGTQCGQTDSLCFSDPLGYYLNPTLANPFPPAMPIYASTGASSSASPLAINTVDETCTARGGICAAHNIPEVWCASTVTIFGITMCNSMMYGAPENFALAQTSAVLAPFSAIITDTSDIMNGNVGVKLTAPSNTSGDLYPVFHGADATGTTIDYGPYFPSLSTGSQNVQLKFDDVVPAIYGTADGAWYPSQTVNIPTYTLSTPWTYFRKIYYTQYNVPHESACSGSDANAWLVTSSVVKGKTTCKFTNIKLSAQFIAATWMNGTGVDLDGDILKSAAAVNLGDMQSCAGEYPTGAIGHGKAGGNTFELVSSVVGSCNSTLAADQSLARPCTQVGKKCPAAVLSGVRALSCGDQLNLDSGNYTTASTRSADDLCPACSDASTFHGADGHIDAFSSNTSCTGRAVGSLGFFYTSYPTN